MSADLSPELAGWDAVCNSLAEIRASHEDFDHFFSEVFDELDALSRKFLKQQQTWRSGRRQAEEELSQRAIQLDQQRTELTAELERLQRLAMAALEGGGHGGDNSQQLQSWQEQSERDRAVFQSAIESAQTQSAQLSEVVGQLGQVRLELAEARQELQRRGEEADVARADSPPTAVDEGLQAEFDQVQEERRLLQQERVVLESELEAVRNRAAEMAETLAEQKRQMAEQRDAWSLELRQMRLLLESLPAQLNSHPQPVPVGSPEAEAGMEAVGAVSAPAVAAGDAVLDSVMAQFQMLQKDRARQRENAGKLN